MVSHDLISPIQSQRGPVPAASLDLGFDASKTAPVPDCRSCHIPYDGECELSARSRLRLLGRQQPGPQSLNSHSPTPVYNSLPPPRSLCGGRNDIGSTPPADGVRARVDLDLHAKPATETLRLCLRLLPAVRISR